jgi:hypothetical protein
MKIETIDQIALRIRSNPNSPEPERVLFILASMYFHERRESNYGARTKFPIKQFGEALGLDYLTVRRIRLRAETDVSLCRRVEERAKNGAGGTRGLKGPIKSQDWVADDCTGAVRRMTF